MAGVGPNDIDDAESTTASPSVINQLDSWFLQ